MLHLVVNVEQVRKFILILISHFLVQQVYLLHGELLNKSSFRLLGFDFAKNVDVWFVVRQALHLLNLVGLRANL